MSSVETGISPIECADCCTTVVSAGRCAAMSTLKSEIVTKHQNSGAMKMKSGIKLYGPKISDGIAALEDMVKGIRDDVSFKRILTTMDPSLDLMTEQMIADGDETLGDYDFVIEWRGTPPRRNLHELIGKIDQVLKPTGCKYTITTK